MGKFRIKKKHLPFDEDRKKIFLKDRSEISGTGNSSTVTKNVDSSVNYYYLAPCDSPSFTINEVSEVS